MKKFIVALALALSCALLLSGAGLAAETKGKEKPKPPAEVKAKPKPIDPAQLKAAEGYWNAAQISAMIMESMDRMAMRIPEAERAKFKAEVSDKLMASGRIKKATVEAAARTFNRKELEAITKFYASPEGRSSMQKMPQFMSQLSRIVQMELVGLMEKARAEDAKKEAAEKAKQKKEEPKAKAPAKAKETKKGD
jgi:hypothetical protein